MTPLTEQVTEATLSLPTIWHAPDPLWETIEKVLAVYDPPNPMGRPRADERQCFDGIIFRMRTGCQWNHLPKEFGHHSNVLRWMVRTGTPWRMIPNDLPPWYTIYQQSVRWIKAECFIALVHDLRELLRVAQGRPPQPTATIFDGRTLQSTPESVERAGYDGAKRKKGSKIHIAVDTLGHLLAMHVTPANAQERAQVAELAAQVQEATEQSVMLAYVDQGYTGDVPADAAKAQGIELYVVKLPEAKKGFVLLPRRWVVELSFAWAARFRRLARDYERLPETLAGLHYVVFALLMLGRAAKLWQNL